MMDKLAEKLGIPPSELWYLKNESLAMVNSGSEPAQLSSDAFCIIRDWYHFAIIELMRTRGFRSEPRWIAKRLGLTVMQVRLAIERLIKLELIEISADGTWIDKAGNNTVILPLKTDGARRELQRQILDLAIRALEDTPVTERDQMAMTLAFDRKKLPEAREFIKKFRRQFLKVFQTDLEGEDVYHLSISFYPVTKKSAKKLGGKTCGI